MKMFKVMSFLLALAMFASVASHSAFACGGDKGESKGEVVHSDSAE